MTGLLSVVKLFLSLLALILRPIESLIAAFAINLPSCQMIWQILTSLIVVSAESSPI